MYKYANTTGVVYENGKRLALEVDQIWNATDPFVKARPDLFSDAPDFVNSTVAPVEQATAAPGEKRTTKRVRK